MRLEDYPILHLCLVRVRVREKVGSGFRVMVYGQGLGSGLGVELWKLFGCFNVNSTVPDHVKMAYTWWRLRKGVSEQGIF